MPSEHNHGREAEQVRRMTEWDDLVEFSREQSKSIWDRTHSQPESSDEWQRIYEAGIGPFERIRRADPTKLSMSNVLSSKGPDPDKVA